MSISYRTAAAGVVAAAIASAGASAAIVGRPATFSWTSSGTPVDSRTFIVSSLLPEYYYSRDYGNGSWASFGVDVRETSVTFTADFAGLAATFFPSGNQFRLTLSPTVALAGASIASMTGVSNLAQGDLSVSGNVITVDASNVTFGAPGGTFTINFSAVVPGPSALLGMAGATALLGRVRNR
jgi:hypothetical protein